MQNDPNALPIALGVRVKSGQACPRLSPTDAAQIISPDLPEASARSQSQGTLGPNSSVDDPNDLTQTGWCVVFASDADPELQKQLQPLLDLRKRQVDEDQPPGQPSLFKIFAGPDPYTGGVQPNQDAKDWARMHSINLTAPVVPGKVPYYMLIVGSPERIPFDFHAKFKLQWLVGRLYFDDLADYGRYAAQVVAQEGSPWQPMPVKNAAVWLPSNPGDIATAMLSGAIAGDFRDGSPQLGAGNRCDFTLDCFVGPGQATKQQLKDIFLGKLDHGKPSVVFTGSHGIEFDPPVSAADYAAQRATQGALITQEWTPVPGKGVPAEAQFTEADIPPGSLAGTMVFMFACFSAGCPATDNYYFNADGSPIVIAPAPLISRLAQKMLANGALAVIGHVDRAFPYGFVDVAGTPQVQAMRTPLERLMQGWRAGRAADSFTTMWSSIAAAIQCDPPANPPANLAATVNAHIARDDARNYIVLGDPAVRLRVKDDSV